MQSTIYDIINLYCIRSVRYTQTYFDIVVLSGLEITD